MLRFAFCSSVILGKMKPPCWICSNVRGSIQTHSGLFFLPLARLFIGCGLPVQRFAHARRGAAFSLGAQRLRLVRRLPMHQATHRPMNMRACPPSSFTDAFPISLIPSVNKVPVSLCRTDGFEVLGFIAVRNPSVLQQNRKKRHLHPYDQSCFVQQ